MNSNRKKYLLDREFQLRTSFTIVGFVTAIVALLLVLVGFNSLDINSKISNIIQIETNTVDNLMSFTGDMPEEYKAQVRALYPPHKNNMDKMQAMIRTNSILLFIMLAIIIIQAVILFFLLIRKTHKIAGPMYVMSQYMKQFLDGQTPEKIRSLRDNDMMKDFYGLFREMMAELHRREKAAQKDMQKKS